MSSLPYLCYFQKKSSISHIKYLKGLKQRFLRLKHLFRDKSKSWTKSKSKEGFDEGLPTVLRKLNDDCSLCQKCILWPFLPLCRIPLFRMKSPPLSLKTFLKSHPWSWSHFVWLWPLLRPTNFQNSYYNERSSKTNN